MLPYKYLQAQDLYEIMQHKYENENNFVHLLIIYNQFANIKNIFENLKKFFNEAQFQEISTSKGRFGRSLLHLAASDTKYLQTHSYLWEFFKSSNELLSALNVVVIFG